MATSYTSLLGFALPVQGELSGTWGDVVNNSITQLVEDSVAGSATADVTSGNWTLTTTGSGAANEARSAILIPTGTPGTSRNIVAPSSSKAYIVDNQSDGAVVIKGSATTGTTIAAGAKAVVAWNGSDFITISTSTADGVTSVSGTGTVNGITLTGTVTSTGNLTLGGTLSGVDLTSQVTGTLPVANGGTGATSLTSNNVILGNGTSAVQFVAPGSSGNVLTSNGTTWASTTPTAQAYPGAGIAVSTGSAWTTSLTAPSGTIVGTTDSQTLTNKTITNLVNDGSITEEVYALGTSGSLALDPANGTIQTCALTGDPTFTDSLSAGQSIVLMLTNGASYTVTWPTITWATASGDTAPTLTAADTLVFWKISTTLYGAYVGSYA